MRVDFRVHGVAEGRANVQTDVDGEAVTATVPCLEVELVTTSERNGNLTLRFVGSNIEAARALFGKDAAIAATFEVKA